MKIKSSRQAVRAIKAGSVSLDGIKKTDPNEFVPPGKYSLKVGRDRKRLHVFGDFDVEVVIEKDETIRTIFKIGATSYDEAEKLVFDFLIQKMKEKGEREFLISILKGAV